MPMNQMRSFDELVNVLELQAANLTVYMADVGATLADITAVEDMVANLTAMRNFAEVIVADIENAPWPLAGRSFDVVVVTNYLWRALLPTLVASVADGGALIYETFARGNETVGKPSNPDYLLAPGELRRATDGLRTVAYEDGFVAGPPERFVQRSAAVRRSAASTPAQRDPL